MKAECHGKAENAVAVGSRAFGRALRRRRAIVAAQFKAGSVGGRVGGEPCPGWSGRNSLKDQREDEDADGETPPATHRACCVPIHAGPRFAAKIQV